MKLSPTALISFINALFNAHHRPSSTVSYLSTGSG
jgi:hypothetical protein